MRVRVLGDVEVLLADGRPADLGGPKPRALLGLLVAAGGRPVPVEQLVDEVWGEEPPARVEASLQSYVARLRRELEPGRGARVPATRLRTHPGAYSLAVDEVDADRLADLVGRAQDAAGPDPGGAARLLAEALGLWRGEPYPGLGWCPSLAAEATRLRELHAAAQEAAWRLRLDRGDSAGVAAELGRAVVVDPLRERRWALLALAQYRGARQGDALATLRRARETLADELGVDPGEELRALEAAVLRQDPELDGPRRGEGDGRRHAVPSRHDGPAGPPAGPPAVAPSAGPSVGPSVGPAVGPSVAPPQVRPRRLAGRDRPLADVDAALSDAAAGRGRVVLVHGEAGIGKTRFVAEVVAAAGARGFRTGRGTWDADGGPAMWGWTRATREALGTDVLAVPGGEVVDAASLSLRLADALLAALRGPVPSVLLLDDVHWADPDSLRLVRRVAAQVGDVPAVLVLAMRDTGADAPPAVQELLGSLARLDVVRVQLGGLDADAVSEYVHHDAGVRLTRDAAEALVARTGGNPLYVTELVRLLGAEGALARPGSEAWQRVPRGVLDVVRQRLAQLDAPAPGLLTTAAVVGRGFDVDVVARSARCPVEDVEDAVEAGLALGLLEPVGEAAPTRFRFVHALVADALRENVPAPARTRLHAAVAVALEEHHAGRLGAHVAEVAEHYRLAGPAQARSAWVLTVAAAQQAADRSAHAEALRLFRLAAALQRPGLVDAVEAEAVLVGQTRALRRLARPVEAWHPAAAAARSALDRGDPTAAAAALLDVTEDAVWGWRFRPAVDRDAIALWQEVLEATGGTGAIDPLPPVTRSLTEAALATELLHDRGSLPAATALVDTAVSRARAEGTPAQVAAVLQVACVALSRMGVAHHRAALAQELVEVTTRLGDGRGLALALTKRASGRGELGLWDEAYSDLVRARELARRHHHLPVLLVAGYGVGVVRQSRAEWGAATAELDELEHLEETLAMPGVGVVMAQRLAVLLHQDRLGELEPALRAGAQHAPEHLRDLYALHLVRTDRTREARLLLGAWADQPPVDEDYLWPTMTVLRAWLWLELDDAAAVAALRARLEPHAHLVAAGGMSSFFLGSLAHTVGRLALHSGDVEGARRHLLAARQAHERMGLPGWVERTDALLARAGAA
ncbi:BTAD domain-containing putative transcriptional regulator [Aquipuribacter sp. SD81]|uniref:BTAD domain-containing putative transcriptional regulator n=1 Tax=Aquipuribacter sp. SD81 TaxID=3127703 RepID=UPI00301B05D7